MKRTSQYGMLSLLTIAAGVVGVALSVAPASAADTATGKIKEFSCGDNCYLTITPDKGEDLTGLCSAPACEPWNAEAVMPDDQIGRKVKVTIEMGQQVDGSGNVMGDFQSFVAIDFLK